MPKGERAAGDLPPRIPCAFPHAFRAQPSIYFSAHSMFYFLGVALQRVHFLAWKRKCAKWLPRSFPGALPGCRQGNLQKILLQLTSHRIPRKNTWCQLSSQRIPHKDVGFQFPSHRAPCKNAGFQLPGQRMPRKNAWFQLPSNRIPTFYVLSRHAFRAQPFPKRILCTFPPGWPSRGRSS